MKPILAFIAVLAIGGCAPADRDFTQAAGCLLDASRLVVAGLMTADEARAALDSTDRTGAARIAVATSVGLEAAGVNSLTVLETLRCDLNLLIGE